MTNDAPDAGAWAAREVGLPPDATPDEVRAALLCEVTREGFAPPPARQRAWQVLCAPTGSPPPCPPEALVAEEGRLRDEIDDFAASFFTTPVGARRQRWRELSALAAFSPPLAARLAALEPGLDLDVRPGGIGNPRTEQLASHVAGLFVLAPAARAAQRQAVLRGMQGDIVGWEEAARQLQATLPALAELEPTLLSSILGWRGQQQRLAKLREARGQAGRRPAARPAPAPRAPAAPAPASGAGGKAIGGGAVLVAFFIIRACVGLGSHSSSSTPPPTYTPPPKFEFQPVDPEGFERTRKALDELERVNREIEEQNKRRGQPGARPPWEREEPDPFRPQREDERPFGTKREERAPAPGPQPRKP